MADYTLSELQSALGSAKQANDAISVQTIQNAIANGDYKQPQMPKQVVKPDVGATAKDLPFYQSRPDLPMPYNLLPKQQSHTAGQVATGIGEAASGLITGMTTGGAGYLGGLLRGIGNSVAEGTFGSRAGAIDASNLAEASARRLTYEPKTELGNRYLSKAVGFLEPLNALGGVAGDLGAISDLASAAKPALVNDFLHPTAPVLESTSNITRGTEPASASVIRDMLMEHKVEAEALLKEQTTPEGIANVTADLNNTNAKLAEIEAQAKQAVPQEEPTIAQALNKPADEGDMIKLLMDASSGNKSAQAKIAQEAKINPEIVNAAERLGIDLPSDLFSENTTLKQGAGATRSVVGEPSAAWRDTVRHATEEADNAIAQLGGANDIASMSEQVKDSLNTTRGTLKNQASELYTAVDNAIPKNTEVTTDKLKTTLAEISQEVGGELSPVEKQLIDKINGDTPITYGGLLRLKGQIGDALSSKISQSPFGSVDTSSLKRIYNAIKDDQLSNVEALAGTDTRDMLFQANRLTQKQKALEERMIGAFGSEGEGSIATLMTRALSQGSKGDITALNKLMKTVPEELKKDTIATALVNMSKSKRGIDAGSFDFNGFTKLYQGIRQNKPVYDTVISALGKDKEQLLMDLYQVSKSIVEAEKNVSTTGASNQLFMRALEHISLREKIVKKVLGKTLDTATLGIVPASELIGHLFKTTPEKAKAIGELLRSQEFKDALLKEVKSENQVMGKPKAESSGLLFSASDNTDYRMEHKAPKPDGMNTGDNVRDILYSLEGKKTTSTTPEQVLSQVKSSLGNNYSKFENDIVIVPNKEALPKDHHHFQIDAFEYARQDKSVGVQGFYDEKDNKVYIIANRTMPKEIDGIINHELFHRHLQQELVGVMNKEGVGKAQALLGSKYQSIVDRMNELAKTDPLVKKAKDKSLTYKDNQDEEMMAYLIQYHSGLKGTAREFVVQLISALRQAVAKSALKLGFKPNKVLGYMNSKDIANLLRRETTQGKNIPISE